MGTYPGADDASSARKDALNEGRAVVRALRVRSSDRTSCETERAVSIERQRRLELSLAGGRTCELVA